jgi:hypothetical protein
MNNELKFGLYAGLAFAIWCMLEFLTGLHNDHFDIAQYTEIAGGLIPWIFIYAGIRYRKQMLQNGQLTFGQGVRAGMIISLVSSVVISVFLYAYVNLINTNYNASKINFLKAELIKAKVPADVYKQQMDGFQNMYSGTITSHFSLLVSFASVGIVISALVSLILRTKTVLPSDN